MTRHLRLRGVENFRDYGDYPTASGAATGQGAALPVGLARAGDGRGPGGASRPWTWR